jgi:1,4-alpha-glucan branching enzyme
MNVEEVVMFKCSKSASAVKVTFALDAEQYPQPISVLGDFNDWDPLANPLKKRSNGTLSASVEIPIGQVVRFKYLDGDGTWFCDPDAATILHDEYHTVDSLLVV